MAVGLGVRGLGAESLPDSFARGVQVASDVRPPLEERLLVPRQLLEDVADESGEVLVLAQGKLPPRALRLGPGEGE